MTYRENALETIRFGNPGWVAAGLPDYSLSYLGCNHEGYEGGGHHLPVGSSWTDIWGTVWRREHPGVMGFPRGNPLADMESLKTYRWPDPDDGRICGRIYVLAGEFPGGDLFLTGSNRDTLWEKAYMLVGMENMMAYFLTEPEYAREILHKIMDFQLGIAAHYALCGVEAVYMGDDLGAQGSLLLGPRIVEEFLVPEYKRLFGFYKRRGILINFHSCGHIEPLLDLFMDLGADILNPLQASANDLSAIRRRTQGRMALAGGVPTGVMMDGPPQKIREAVYCAIRLLGAQGGYFCAPDQAMPFPEAHLEAYEEALREYGRYPLRI